ncbi:hypothetical protein NDU88_005819 [Pleurodeles waltl]|uniref:Uncharacterized protein n=1 Tax=Pleurodeles waltl TaxID=8319 RepID=A0AAV7UMU7_PLEWA|nr:hypothetical protein NDU88_005819 [Pleurodeles waltl]
MSGVAGAESLRPSCGAQKPRGRPGATGKCSSQRPRSIERPRQRGEDKGNRKERGERREVGERRRKERVGGQRLG